MDRFFKTRKIKCADKTIRLVHRDPADAFQLYASNWSADLESSIGGLGDFEGKLSADVRKSIGGYFAQIDDANKSMQLSFAAIYVVYTTNPCNNDEYLKQNVALIINREDKLRRLRFEISKLEKHRTSGISDDDLKTEIYHSIKRLKADSIQADIEDELKEAETQFHKWKKQ